MKNELEIGLWGPSAAGKTALLAQLYLSSVRKALRSGEWGEWEIFPSAESIPFIEQMRGRLEAENLFPAASPVGRIDRLAYRFANRSSGTAVSVFIEDRAGVESETLDAVGRERLNRADGLLLLFDPTRNAGRLEAE